MMRMRGLRVAMMPRLVEESKAIGKEYSQGTNCRTRCSRNTQKKTRRVRRWFRGKPIFGLIVSGATTTRVANPVITAAKVEVTTKGSNQINIHKAQMTVEETFSA